MMNDPASVAVATSGPTGEEASHSQLRKRFAKSCDLMI
jgi:hypothetical protein